MIVDGKKIAAQTERKLAKALAGLPRPLGLSITIVGDHPASRAYVERKQRLAARLGVAVYLHELIAEDSDALG